MVIRRNRYANVEDFNPAVEGVIDYIKRYRAMTGKRLNLLEKLLMSEEESAQLYRNGSYGEPVYNLTPEQIEWMYPASSNPNWDFEKEFDSSYIEMNEKLLNDLVPTISPTEDYFEKGELEAVKAMDTPLSSAPIDFIHQYWSASPFIIFADRDRTKPYNCTRYKITLLNDVDIQKFIPKLVNGLTGFLKLNENGETEVVPKFGLVYPNFWGSINDTEFLRTRQDLDDLVEELDPTRIKESVLHNTFSSETGLLESGVNFHRILAYEVLVNAYPSGFLLR